MRTNCLLLATDKHLHLQYVKRLDAFTTRGSLTSFFYLYVPNSTNHFQRTSQRRMPFTPLPSGKELPEKVEIEVSLPFDHDPIIFCTERYMQILSAFSVRQP